jgi:hypothetical protein
MTTFNLPSSITVTNPYSATWSSLDRASAVNASNPADTATKVHFAAQGSSGGVDIFFELNNGIITADVDSAPTGGSPHLISKTGYSNGSGSVTVSGGDTLYMYNTTSANLGSFVFNGSWVTSGSASGRTGQSVNNSGTATQNNYGALSFIVSAGSNSSESYSISLAGDDKATITPVGVGPWYKNYTFAEHSAIGYGEWILYDQAGLLATITTTAPATPPPAPPATSTPKRKVHCNFW